MAAGIATPPRRPDVALFSFAQPTPCAALFTSNTFAAAPVVVARKNLSASAGLVRAWLINAGNANCGTGKPGMQTAQDSCRQVAGLLRCPLRQVLPFSTGVIMEPLARTKLLVGAKAAFANLAPNNWACAARAIMTTDTVPKGTSASFRVAGKRFRVTGVAKGAGMIHPNMATMLAFLATDASASPAALRRILAAAAADSFNAISVDGDTSTNDALVLAATGSEPPATGPALAALAACVTKVCARLAQALVADGEGCTRTAAVTASGFASRADCRTIAEAVARSPLVKTMLHAGDPNLGRVLMAIGNAPVKFRPDRLRLLINGKTAFANGSRNPRYNEQAAGRDFGRSHLRLTVIAGRGRNSFTCTFSDLSAEYVRINTDYRS